MTAQIPDRLTDGADEYAIAGVAGTLFEPPRMPTGYSTGCYRGYFCRYECKSDQLYLRDMSVFSSEAPPPIEGVAATMDAESSLYTYSFDREWYLDGRLVLVSGLQTAAYGAVTPQPASYAVVKEYLCRQGRVLERRDHSGLIRDIRGRLEAFLQAIPLDRDWTREEFRAYQSIMWSFAPGVRSQPDVFREESRGRPTRS